MVTEIRLYYEGDRSLRQSFGVFFQVLREKARSKKIHWEIIACKGRSEAFRDFRNALIDHPHAFNILLVDSEAPVEIPRQPWTHLCSRIGDEWVRPEGVSDIHCHLMVQAMEAWFHADRTALKSFYKNNFRESALPSLENGKVENIPKDRLEPTLKEATKNTTKGEYHKTRHAPKLLEAISPAVVRAASIHCDFLFRTLENVIDQPIPDHLPRIEIP